jgi:hypothetical protein
MESQLTKPDRVFFGLALLLLATCYRPEIKDARLQCSPDGQCPGNFKCQNGVCVYQDPSTGGGTCSNPEAPYGPFENCKMETAAGAVCDPVCQSGCGCKQRCTVTLTQGAQCVKQVAPFDSSYQRCDTNKDRCEPGQICLGPAAEIQNDECGGRCYRFCRIDTDCKGSGQCNVELAQNAGVPAYKVCSPPPEMCSPLGAGTCKDTSQFPSGSYGCYLLGTQTICDCAGTRQPDATCDSEQDLHTCIPGYECIMGKCRRLCTAITAISLCGSGQMCKQWNSRFGYCK